MKYFILTLLLFQATFSYSQRYKDGFVTFKNDSILLTKVRIPYNGKSLKYLENGNKIKMLKADFKDYGLIIENGQKYSLYGATSFRDYAFDGLMVTEEQDTLPCYFVNPLVDEIEEIKGYYKDRTPFNIQSDSNVISLSIKNYEDNNYKDKYEYIWYDQVSFEQFGFKKSADSITTVFLERKLDTEIKLYMHIEKKMLTSTNRQNLGISYSKKRQAIFLLKIIRRTW